MSYNPEKYHRRSIRLKGYDYAQAGAYIVTIVSKDRACLFGAIAGDVMRLNTLGEIVQDEWLKSADIRREIELDEYVVMPNHVHGILLIHEVRDAGTPGRAPGSGNPTLPREAITDSDVRADGRPPLPGSHPHPERVRRTQHSLGSFVAGFNSAATTRINRYRHTPGTPVWQRNYYEHIIRDDTSLNRFRKYIVENPLRWALDDENPFRSPA